METFLFSQHTRISNELRELYHIQTKLHKDIIPSEYHHLVQQICDTLCGVKNEQEENTQKNCLQESSAISKNVNKESSIISLKCVNKESSIISSLKPLQNITNNITEKSNNKNKPRYTDTVVKKKDPDVIKIPKCITHFPTKNPWVQNITLEDCIDFDVYNENNKEFNFKKVADIELDNDIFDTGKRIGKKKREYVIKFDSVIDVNEYSKSKEWIYAFVINNKLVKIGGTRTGLKSRTVSYLCGHHTTHRNKSGRCSVTNAIIYNTFEFYLENGFEIEMYAVPLPQYAIEINLFGSIETIIPQIYHTCESLVIKNLEEAHCFTPPLSPNCDPNYRKKKNKEDYY